MVAQTNFCHVQYCIFAGGHGTENNLRKQILMGILFSIQNPDRDDFEIY